MYRDEAVRKAKALVAQMTVEEAAGQLIFNAPAIERLGIPAYNWWNEALHGVARAGTATVFPQAIGIAAAFDPDLSERIGGVIATEGRAKYNESSKHGDRDIYKGLTFWSPNVNIFRDPRWGRGHETYGEDPFLTSCLGAAFVRGLQGDAYKKGGSLKAAACAKHFAGHSGPEAERHHFNAVITKKDMAETYLPAFRKLVEEGVEAVMGAYNRTNGEPCCGSKTLMKTLRDEWGFQGHFVSDCWAVKDFHEHHKVTSRPEESVALALKTGCDVNCGCTYQFVMNAYREGLVSEEDIRRSAVRLFTTRYMLGLMDGSEYDDIPYETLECPEHLAVAREAAEKGCVLLKNNGLLPLRREKLRTVGVIGPNADNRTALIGNYHGTSSRYVTILEGLQDRLGDDVRVLYSAGSHLCLDNTEDLAQKDDRISEAVTVAEHSDVVVLVVGLDETIEGEEVAEGNMAASGGDKADLLLPAGQRHLMDAVLKTGKPTVICVCAGSSVDIGEAADKADAVLYTWYPGARGGWTVADILLGKVSPSGKLPVTLYRNEQLERMPAFTDYSMRDRTYRYFTKEPLYPFGYGLTYGDCSVQNAEKRNGGVSVLIRNDGTADTQEVVQIYAQNEGSGFAPANPRLVGFQRVFCPAGKTVTCDIFIAPEDLRVVNDDGEWIDDGRVVLYAGLGQPDERTRQLTGHGSIKVDWE